MKMVKQRQESITLYKQGNRADLVQQEEEEIAIIERFMPKQMDEGEAAAAIDAAVAETGAQSVKDMGKVMAKLKERFAGRLDLSKAGALVQAAAVAIAPDQARYAPARYPDRGDAGEGASSATRLGVSPPARPSPMSFTPQFLDELRQRLSLVSVISRKVRLVRRGRESTGLCPFHNEKSPSFTVSDEKGFFHCFGCGAHGDVIGFLMRSEGLSFPESVERLAREAGLAVPVSSPEERQRAERQATLVTAMETAAAWYQEQLGASAGRGALDYLRRRGLAEGTIARFRLGYAPEGRTALRDALAQAGVSHRAGAWRRGWSARARMATLFDRMRGRVIFPIADRRGRVIAFGGRILGEGQPKYLNSPETPLFHKGRTLYGLGQALRPATDAGEVVVAEGYMDVIALAQAGFRPGGGALGHRPDRGADRRALAAGARADPLLRRRCGRRAGGGPGGRAGAAAAEAGAIPALRPAAGRGGSRHADPRRRLGGHAGGCWTQALPLAEIVWRGGLLAGKTLDTPGAPGGPAPGSLAAPAADRRQGRAGGLSGRVQRPAGEAVQPRQPRGRRQGPVGSPGRAPGGRPGGRRDGRRWGPAPILGGEALRQTAEDPIRLRCSTILATLIHHPELIERRTRGAGASDFAGRVNLTSFVNAL